MELLKSTFLRTQVKMNVGREAPKHFIHYNSVHHEFASHPSRNHEVYYFFVNTY
jgi:hypothetical protein